MPSCRGYGIFSGSFLRGVIVAKRLGVAASGNAAVSQTAVEILKAGGNAFDAVLGALCTASIAEPLLVSLGGGGFLLALPDGQAPPHGETLDEWRARLSKPRATRRPRSSG
jgi:gamma-glutamyltranspeptidase/glutathione hydrolase